MEQINSNSRKKIQQLDIFKKYAKTQNTNSDKNALNSGEFVLSYDDFIKLISNSQRLYAKFTDHSFNLNQIPTNTFGCIFFAIDEYNKGYLTINDWFYFNNILESDNYSIILLYEFFRKFDTEKLRSRAIKESIPIDDQRTKSINYTDPSLSFDNLLLNIGQFKDTIKLLQATVDDHFVRDNNILLDWNKLPSLRLYEIFPFGGFHNIDKNYFQNHNQNDIIEEENSTAYISLNSLINILQNDLKNEKLHIGFDRLSQIDPKMKCLTINKNQLTYLLKLFYSHRVSADIFESLNFSNGSIIKWNNHSISYSIFKDIFYLFQNFDLLNQVLLKHATINDMSGEELREQVITREKLLALLNTQYNKVNNITQFSPSQIDLLFSIVSNSKQLNRRKNKDSLHISNFDSEIEQEKKGTYHEDNEINNFIKTEYIYGMSTFKKNLELFNVNYNDLSNEFHQDNVTYKNTPTTKRSLFRTLFGKVDANQTDLTKREALTIEDFLKVLNPNYLNDVIHALEIKKIQSRSLYDNYYFYPIFDSIYNFCLGSVAGCIGATVVYPIDFIKTRMQAQRSIIKYKNSIDCLVKVIKSEGIRGLYSGLGFQLIGVAPEKAIKLTVNDYMRKKLVDSNNKLSVLGEIISGASAGMCQIIFTNPIEIVKIRLQVKSEYASNSDINAIKIIRTLGLSGLYKGIVACMMRDIPFSAIYFPTYAHLKENLFQFDPNDKTKRNKLKTSELLLAGGLAGMPAAFLTTPFDVVKTRLQIEPKAVETRYTGIFHAFKTILKEESFGSFFKGGGARVLRSSPQFGFTLAAYEIFKNIFPSPNIGPDESDGNGGGEIGGIPSVTNSLTSFYKNTKQKSNSGSQMELFGPTVDPYSSNYLNYYYKSCEVAKTFIDLDNNFARFDHTVYSKFSDHLKDISSTK